MHSKQLLSFDISTEADRPRTADMLAIGDAVVITGKVISQGSRGEIARFGALKRFVIVRFKDGSEHSYLSSDVCEAGLDSDSK